jgi:enterochelin esterase-like enzyme
MRGAFKQLCHFGLLSLLLGCALIAQATSSLSDNIRIESEQLAYDLQYRVYLPDNAENLSDLPVIFVTDGQWYLDQGNMQDVLDEEIESGRIKPVAAVFVDSSNPDNRGDNRRNSEFMCNKYYALFFANELIPAVVDSFPVSHLPADRVILGVSFGGLNAACFGLMLPQIFPNIAMQSPASDKHIRVLTEQYRQKGPLPLKIFFSNGTRRDNLSSSRAFHELLQEQGYDVTYIEVAQSHNWKNWRPLLDDVLHTFFSFETQQQATLQQTE